MSDMNDRYKKAAKLRLMTAMSGGPTQPAPGVPNYSAIPLEPFKESTRPPQFGNGFGNILQALGFGPKSAGAAQAPGARPAPSVEPSPAFPQAPMPPAANLGSLPPMNATAQDYDAAARGGPQMPVSAPPQMPAAPQGANAAFQPPPGWMPPADYMRTQGDADLGGYGGNPGMGAPIPAPPQYTHLNPTPGLEEIFRREYAANPGAFGKIG
jgi:hypothetical protein